MPSTKLAFAGSTATAITCTLASLASAAARESNWVDNTSNLFLDALVQVKVKTSASALGSDKAVYIYAAAIIDPTTPVYPDACTGADGGITLNSPTQLPLLGVIWTPSTSTSYVLAPKSLAYLFGGTLPQKWGLVIVNSTGQALDATAGNFLVAYQGVYATTA
jgi:hypothetical protein